MMQVFRPDPVTDAWPAGVTDRHFEVAAVAGLGRLGRPRHLQGLSD